MKLSFIFSMFFLAIFSANLSIASENGSERSTSRQSSDSSVIFCGGSNNESENNSDIVETIQLIMVRLEDLSNLFNQKMNEFDKRLTEIENKIKEK